MSDNLTQESDTTTLTESIFQRGDKWVLKFSDGREEEFDSEEAAKKREREVQFFKKSEAHSLDGLREERGGKCETCSSAEGLDFAHVKKTKLSGAGGGRGQGERYYDIKNNPESYLLLCKDCHHTVDHAKLESVHFNESFHLIEAKSKDGSEWEIVAIEEGQSKNNPPNNFVYESEVLKKSLPLFNKANVFAYQFKGVMKDLLDHLPEPIREAAPKGLSRNVVGFLKNARFGEFDRSGRTKKGVLATFVVTADWLKEALSNAWKHGKKNLFGFSIDAEGPAELRERKGKLAPVVKSIEKLNELTLVTEAAAASGRQFLRLLASNTTNQQLMEHNMRDHILKQIQEKAPHLLEGKKFEELTEQQVWDLLQEALNASNGDKEKKEEKKKEEEKDPEKIEEGSDLGKLMALIKAGKLDEASDFFSKRFKKDKKKEAEPPEKKESDVLAQAKALIDPLTQKIADLEAKATAKESAATAEKKLAESKLPDTAKAKLRESISILEPTPEQIDQLIKSEQDHLAKLSESGRVTGLGGQTIEVGSDELDKFRLAMDGFFEGEAQKDKDGKFVNPFVSIKEAYKYISNDPWADDPSAIIADSYDFIPQLPDAPGFQPSFNHRRRLAMREAWKSQRLRESLSSSSWGEILGDSITRKMIKEYTLSEKVKDFMTLVSNSGPVNDFRTQRRMKLGGYGTLSTVAQGATYPTLTSPTDAEETYAISKKGGLENLTMEMIADDDVNAIRLIPVRLSRAAEETLYRGGFDLFTDNGTMGEDSITLFHASHTNSGTTALADAEVSVVRGLMRSQAAYGNSSEILGQANAPKYLLVPNELETTAWELSTSPVKVESGFDATVPNIHVRKYVTIPIVVDYWTNATDWFAVADPKKQPTIEAGFFQGRREPELFVSDNPNQGSVFTADKISYKIRHIWGLKVLDWRSFYYENVA
jgi:hypothetical protein